MQDEVAVAVSICCFATVLFVHGPQSTNRQWQPEKFLANEASDFSYVLVTGVVRLCRIAHFTTQYFILPDYSTGSKHALSYDVFSPLAAHFSVQYKNNVCDVQLLEDDTLIEYGQQQGHITICMRFTTFGVGL